MSDGLGFCEANIWLRRIYFVWTRIRAARKTWVSCSWTHSLCDPYLIRFWITFIRRKLIDVGLMVRLSLALIRHSRNIHCVFKVNYKTFFSSYSMPMIFSHDFSNNARSMVQASNEISSKYASRMFGRLLKIFRSISCRENNLNYGYK